MEVNSIQANENVNSQQSEPSRGLSMASQGSEISSETALSSNDKSRPSQEFPTAPQASGTTKEISSSSKGRLQQDEPLLGLLSDLQGNKISSNTPLSSNGHLQQSEIYQRFPTAPHTSGTTTETSSLLYAQSQQSKTSQGYQLGLPTATHGGDTSSEISSMSNNHPELDRLSTEISPQGEPAQEFPIAPQNSGITPGAWLTSNGLPQEGSLSMGSSATTQDGEDSPNISSSSNDHPQHGSLSLASPISIPANSQGWTLVKPDRRPPRPEYLSNAGEQYSNYQNNPYPQGYPQQQYYPSRPSQQYRPWRPPRGGFLSTLAKFVGNVF